MYTTAVVTVFSFLLGWLSYTYRKPIAFWVLECGLYTWFLRDILPKIRFSCRYPKITGKQFNKAFGLARPGDWLLSCDRRKLSYWLTPGEDLVHGALIVDFPEYEVAEMTGKGFTKSQFFDACKADRIVIIRCTAWDQKYINEVVLPQCRKFERSEIPYDKQFRLEPKALYCFELPYACDLENRFKINMSEMPGLGRKYISGQNIYDAATTSKPRNAFNAFVVYDSDVNINQ